MAYRPHFRGTWTTRHAGIRGKQTAQTDVITRELTVEVLLLHNLLHLNYWKRCYYTRGSGRGVSTLELRSLWG